MEDGANVGTDVGWADADTSGRNDGAPLGIEEGASVGNDDRSTEGNVLGSRLGSCVGYSDGSDVARLGLELDTIICRPPPQLQHASPTVLPSKIVPASPMMPQKVSGSVLICTQPMIGISLNLHPGSSTHADGASLMTLLGPLDGGDEPASDGSSVGTMLCFTDGESDDVFVGCVLLTTVGNPVGSDVGMLDGVMLGTSEGSSVG